MIRGLATTWTYFLHLSLSSVINSSAGSPVHVLMLSIRAMRDLPRLHVPGIVPCIIDFSRKLSCFLMVWPWYASFLALTFPPLLQLYSLRICFLCCPRNQRNISQPFYLKGIRRVSSFFLSVQISQPYVATGHTSAFISRIFVEIGMLWLFHIFCSDAPIACPLFNLIRNSVIHSPSSVIRDRRFGNVSTCSSCSFWMSMWHTMPSLQYEIHRGSPSSPSPLGYWISTEKEHNLVGLFS